MLQHRLSLKALRTFERAAYRMSFKDAAEDMFITASAVSHQIKTLEEQMGVLLFQRGTRSLKLTPGGMMYARFLRDMFEQLDTATDKLIHHYGRPSVHLLLPPFFAVEVLLPRLREFQSNSPGVDIRLESYKQAGQAETSGSDLIVTTGEEPRRGFLREHLFPIRFVPACSCQYREERPIRNFRDLNRHVLIVNEGRNDAWDHLANKLGARAPRPLSLIQLDTMSEVTRATQNGLGIGMVLLPLADPAFNSGELVPVFDSPEYMLEENYYLTYRRENDMPEMVNNFKDWMLETFRCKDEKSLACV